MSESKDDWRSMLFLGIGLAGLGLGGGLAAASATMGNSAVAVWGLVFVMVAVVVRSPMAKAMAERFRESPSETTGEIATEVYGELDELRARVLELEERQDFAERLLAARDDEAGPS